MQFAAATGAMFVVPLPIAVLNMTVESHDPVMPKMPLLLATL